jgi:hypothetical protein
MQQKCGKIGMCGNHFMLLLQARDLVVLSRWSKQTVSRCLGKLSRANTQGTQLLQFGITVFFWSFVYYHCHVLLADLSLYDLTTAIFSSIKFNYPIIIKFCCIKTTTFTELQLIHYFQMSLGFHTASLVAWARGI